MYFSILQGTVLYITKHFQKGPQTEMLLDLHIIA